MALTTFLFRSDTVNYNGFFHVKIGVLLFSVVFLFVKLLNIIICFNFLWIYKPPSLEPVRCKNRKKVLTKKLVWEQGTSEDSE